MSPLKWSVSVLMYLCQANKKCIDEFPNSLECHKTMNSGNGKTRNSIKCEKMKNLLKWNSFQNIATMMMMQQQHLVLRIKGRIGIGKKRIKVLGTGFYSIPFNALQLFVWGWYGEILQLEHGPFFEQFSSNFSIQIRPMDEDTLKKSHFYKIRKMKPTHQATVLCFEI